MRRALLTVCVALALLLQPSASAQTVSPNRSKTILPLLPITAAQTATVYDVSVVPAGAVSLSLQANFVYGSGGTTCKAWVQTSLDGGATWIDIANFALTTSSARVVHSVRVTTAVAANYTATDGSLADNTIKDGILGDRLRVKITTTGTYAGSTTLRIDGIFQ
jgi:hypothetical protein